MNIENIQTLLKSHGIHPNKTFGQNFLMNEIVLQDIVDSVPLQRGEALMEVGPGIGNLTKKLLEKNEFVLAVEKDESFARILHSLKKQYRNFRYEFSDVLKFDFQKFLKDYRYHVVANIPYYITGKIIQLFLQAKHKPETLTLLVQKEVAENVIAKPGQLNLLAISVQLYGEAKILEKVPARDFFPAPKVDSAVLQIKILQKPKYEVGDEKKFFKILRACFAGKRKQIHNTLKNNLGLEKDLVAKILEECKVSQQARPQELSIEQWLLLVKKIGEK